MKKRFLATLSVVFALLAHAECVTPAQARAAAAAWAGKNGAFVAGQDVAGRAAAVADSKGVTLWYRVPLANGACMVVSPVTELEPVVAVLENVPSGGLPAAHPVRAMLVRDMTDRLTKLGLYVPSSGGASLQSAAAPAMASGDPAMQAWAEQGKAKWKGLGIGVQGGFGLMEAVTNGLETIATTIRVVDGFEQGGRFTHWDQGDRGGKPVYNYHTPENAVCGCVATAMSAMMQFFAVKGCPEGAATPAGLVRETQDGIYGTTYNGFTTGDTTIGGLYDWETLFPDTMTRTDYDSLDDAQRELLGRVAFDAGVAVAMAWTDDESSAYGFDVAKGLKEVFGFRDARAVHDPSQSQYAALIYNQCRAGAPVFLGIQGEGGHAVLAVGYGLDSDEVARVRVFTGWGGAGDGWYALPYINTKSLPTQSGSYLFDVVDDVVTMVGYETNDTVPVVGRVMGSDGANVTLQLTGGASGEVTTDENGYFGIRVSPGAAKVTVVRNGVTPPQAVTVLIGADAATSNDGAALNAALPPPLLFPFYNDFDAARAAALASGRAVLRVSGKENDAATKSLLDFAVEQEDRFVLVFDDVAGGGIQGDGNPSIGVFLPEASSADGRWMYANGRLSYAFGYSVVTRETVDNDYEVPEEDAYVYVTNEAYRVSYGSEAAGTFVSTNMTFDTEGLLAAAQLAVDEGWAEFCRQTHGISLAVTAFPVEAGEPSPAFGVYTNLYTNGQTVVVMAMDEMTNETAGVVMGCCGWTLTNATTGAFLEDDGTMAEFTVASNDVLTLTWQMETNAVWISVKDGDNGGTTSPSSGWYPYGEEVVFVATPAAGRKFDQWQSGDRRQLPEAIGGDSVFSPVLAFEAEVPFSLMASYEYGTPAGMSVTNTLGVAAVDSDSGDDLSGAGVPPVELFGIPGETGLSVAAGGSVQVPGIAIGARPQADSFVDATGGVWQCTGWILRSGEGEGASILGFGFTQTATFTLEEDATLSWWWQLDSSDPEPERRELTDADVPVGTGGESSSPMCLALNGDGTFTLSVTVGNAVSGYWYALVSDTELDGDYSAVEKYGYADEDGELDVGDIVVDPDEPKKFFKVRILEEEP